MLNIFASCSGLSSIILYPYLVSIGNSAFSGCNINDLKVVVTNASGFCNNGVIKLIRNSIGKPVTLIDNEGIEIKEYNIPDDVTSIGNYAFTNCTGLVSVTIPNSVTAIEESAFSDCSSLTSVIISNSVASIGNSAFYGCCAITSVTIPNNVTTIGDSAFRGCSGLTSVTIPNSVTSIGKNAFYGCSGLSSVILYPNIVSIGNSVFYGCNINNLKVVVTNTSGFCNNGVIKLIRNSIDKPVTLIDNEGIEIKEYNIPDDVTSIGNYAFTNCTGLTSMTIPNSVTTIEESAFQGCSGLTSVTIPNNVTTIGDRVFSGCSGLTSVSLNCKNVGSWFSGNSSIKEVILGNNVESIGSSAFSGCSGLASVTIPNSVTSIGYDAFYKCSKLLSLTIGTGVTTIGQDAFRNTNLKKTIWLTNTPPSGYQYASGTINYVANDQYNYLSNKIVYPFISSLFESDGIYYVPVSPSERTCDAIDCRYDETVNNTNISTTVSYQGIDMTVQKIQPYLCYGNTYIENLKCENNGDIADYAFAGCINIKSVVCNNDGIIGCSAFNGCTNIESTICNNNGIIDDSAFEFCINMTSLSLGENITSIGKSSFKDCSSLKAVNIPDSVTIMDDYSFSGCSSLEEIVIGNHVNTIGNGAFTNCSSLEEIVIGNHVKTISQYAFENCKSLQSINIPNSVNTISNYVFKGCIGLQNLIIADRDSELSLGKNGSSPLFADCPLDSVYIGGNITYYTSAYAGYSPFYRNTTLRTVVITDKETEISPNEFYGCTNLKIVSIGDGVTMIGDWAFSGCSSLDYFSFGSSMQTIGQEAFSDCSAMTNLYSHAMTPPVCGSQALDDINKWNCKLHVPSETLSAYQQADQWKEFFFIDDDLILPYYKLTYMVDSEVYKTYNIEYGATITPEADPTKEGYTFSGWSEIPATMPAHNVTVTGSFSINSYKLTYVVDDVEYKSYDIEYGATITPEAEPTKEGYTFSGWSEIPATMPAHDVTVTGSFSKGQYKLIYMVDGQTYKTISYDYGDAITPEPAPIREGYTFSGWSEIPETMPAHDVTINGTFSINSYKLTYVVDGVEYKSYDVEYGATITPETEPTKEGYIFSGWSGIPEIMPAHDVTVTGTFTLDTGIEKIMSNVNGGVMIFTIDGKRVDNLKKGMNVIRMKDGTTRKVVVK